MSPFSGSMQMAMSPRQFSIPSHLAVSARFGSIVHRPEDLALHFLL